MTPITIPIELADRAYTIHVGSNLFEHAANYLAPLSKKRGITIVSDENVFATQGARFIAGLGDQLSHKTLILPAGEETKSFAQCQKLLNELLDLGLERDDMIVALGGGVIGDITGFAASILKRGCRFAQIPTSLLAQVDSSVGGKTGINTQHGKNLIGSFYQPSIVLCDLNALQTLPPRQFRSGYAEIIKYAAIDDLAFFDWLDTNATKLISGDRQARQYAVAHSCSKKAAIVAADERERGERALLNLGHTFGHALEAIVGYTGALTHGEGVAIGMCMAFDYSVSRGLCPQSDAERFKAHLKSVGLATSIQALKTSNKIDGPSMIGAMMHDKKIDKGGLTLILLHGIGKAHIARDIAPDQVLSFLNATYCR